ncbi:MAG: ankyrin repeat domain-containing protein [Armatimonadota bacterium]
MSNSEVVVGTDQEFVRVMIAVEQHCWPSVRHQIESVPALCQMKMPGEEVTLLHLGAREGHLSIVAGLLAHGADGAAQDALGRTALHYAAENGHTAVAEMLIAAGAGIDATDSDGVTPLMVAVRGGVTDTALMLVKHGANLFLQPKQGMSPAEHAVTGDNTFFIKSALHCGYVAVDACNEDGETLLSYAACAEAWDVVSLLLSRGCGCQCSESAG